VTDSKPLERESSGLYEGYTVNTLI